MNETAGMADVAKTCLLDSRSPISGGCTCERFLVFGRPARALAKKSEMGGVQKMEVR